MIPEANTTQMKLKFKITTKGVRLDSEERSCEKTVNAIVKNGQRHQVTSAGDGHSEVKKLKPSMSVCTKKRSPEMILHSQREKKWRMDRSVKLQCSNILKELMNHRNGWIFSEPVDPVKWNIPGYFSIITDPMDLGTIKRKLEGNLYFSVQEFAADVRLTFSNAMVFNPPGDDVHNLAKLLNGNFNTKWKILEAKLKRANAATDNGQDSKQTVGKSSQVTNQIVLTRAPTRVNLCTNRTMSFEEKFKLRSKLVEVLSGKMRADLHTVFQKFGLTDLRVERLQSYIDATDDETLLKLRREIKVSFDARAGKVEPTKISQSGSYLLGKTLQKGTEKCSRSQASSILRQSTDSTASKCSSCSSQICNCQSKIASVQASLSDVSSESSSVHGHCGDSKHDSEVKYPSKSHTNRLGPDSDGPGVVLNEESSSDLSTPPPTAASGEGWTSLNVLMSPKKALRAALLKSRFAATIYKATHQGEKSGPLRMQQERERLEREQLEEKVRIEKEIKAAEEAIRTKAQAELKMRREREREAARMALENIEKSVEIDENLQILKELEKLCFPQSNFHGRNPLERLGLYMKDDYLEEDGDAVLNGEEGEIVS
ncbi:hypothetical protein ACJIZ3_013320 [Penstemon smallii]|uniref:Bromo domain-containing protein n=1 Tax=Penstemon smallii TaxID=265156 RepID=A0ABD3USF8_9LAMI